MYMYVIKKGSNMDAQQAKIQLSLPVLMSNMQRISFCLPQQDEGQHMHKEDAILSI